MSTRRSRWRIHRVPPGSLLIWRSMTPPNDRDEAVDVLAVAYAAAFIRVTLRAMNSERLRRLLGGLEARDDPLEEQRLAAASSVAKSPKARMCAFSALPGRSAGALHRSAPGAGGCRRRTSRRRGRSWSRSRRRAMAAACRPRGPARAMRSPPMPWIRASFQAAVTIEATLASRVRQPFLSLIGSLPIDDRKSRAR